jgi:hypothetical protein
MNIPLKPHPHPPPPPHPLKQHDDRLVPRHAPRRQGPRRAAAHGRLHTGRQPRRRRGAPPRLRRVTRRPRRRSKPLSPGAAARARGPCKGPLCAARRVGGGLGSCGPEAWGAARGGGRSASASGARCAAAARQWRSLPGGPARLVPCSAVDRAPPPPTKGAVWGRKFLALLICHRPAAVPRVDGLPRFIPSPRDPRGAPRTLARAGLAARGARSP